MLGGTLHCTLHPYLVNKAVMGLSEKGVPGQQMSIMRRQPE